MMKILISGFGSAGQVHGYNIGYLGGFDVEAFDPKHPPMDINYEEFDGFIIASPTGTHLQYLQKLAIYKKPILCEKPIVSDQVPLNRLLELQESNPHIYVAYQMRYLKKIQQLKEAIQCWAFEEIFEITVKYGFDIRRWHSTDHPYLDRHGILLEASHELDYLLFVFGRLEFIQGLLVHRQDFGDAESEAFLRLNISNGIINVSLNYVQPFYERFIRIIGEKGTWQIELTREDIAEARMEMMQDFLGVVTGKPSKQLSTVNDSIKILKLIQQAKKFSKVVL